MSTAASTVAPAVTVAVDVMGGDHGCVPCVEGALLALALPRVPLSTRLCLVGDAEQIGAALSGCAAPLRARLDILHAPQVVTMDDAPRDAIRRKKQSSMRLALDAVAEGRAQAAVSAGNTGALMGMAHFVLGTLPGISRAAILVALPAPQGCTWALDLGANATANPEQLRQFAVMGHLVAREVGGLEQPRVGLLNIGAEELKGNDTVQAAHALLRATPGLNYLGFVEGNAFFSGEVDVVVTDGFSGNVALKSIEGLARFVKGTLREEFTRGPLQKIAGLLSGPVLRRVATRLDPGRYNGASLVGLQGVVVKSHGGADAAAFAQAVATGVLEASHGLPARISAQLLQQA